MEPGHGALHGAEGLVHLRAGTVVQAGVGLAPRTAGVSLVEELLAGRGSVRLVLHVEGWRGGGDVAELRLVQGGAEVCVLQARRGREVLGSVSLRPQLVGHRQL